MDYDSSNYLVWKSYFRVKSLEMTNNRQNLMYKDMNKSKNWENKNLSSIRYLWFCKVMLSNLMSRWIMMTSSNGNIFRVTGPLCAEFTGPGDFPTQRPVTRSFDIFFDLRLNKRLSKQPWGWWFETLSWSLWRHYNDFTILVATKYVPQVNSVTFTIRTNTIRQWIKTG